MRGLRFQLSAVDTQAVCQSEFISMIFVCSLSSVCFFPSVFFVCSRCPVRSEATGDVIPSSTRVSYPCTMERRRPFRRCLVDR
jgi:hypothetical protein